MSGAGRRAAGAVPLTLREQAKGEEPKDRHCHPVRLREQNAFLKFSSPPHRSASCGSETTGRLAAAAQINRDQGPFAPCDAYKTERPPGPKFKIRNNRKVGSGKKYEAKVAPSVKHSRNLQKKTNVTRRGLSWHLFLGTGNY